MSGLFGTLGTATSGITANQVALQTTAHNIANTNTDGYSRQRVHMTTKPPYVIAGTGTIGTGVNVTGVERVVDDFVKQILNILTIRKNQTRSVSWKIFCMNRQTTA